MTPPLVSVIMPVWNGERYLKEAADSILSQTFKEFEFIILDDGSTDSTPEILSTLAERDQRVRIIRLDHEGIVAALNRGISEAKAEWIARMDCDDISHPQRLEKQWTAVQGKPKAVLCHTHTHIVGDPEFVTPAGRFIRSKALLALRLCFQCPIIHPTVMFRKSTVLECGGYLPEERHAEDYGLWGRLLLAGEVVGIPEPVFDFRVHGGSISKQKADVQQELSRKIATRHCRQFMDLDEATAARAYRAIQSVFLSDPLREWGWFIVKCMPRFRWQSLEMWAWIASHTLQVLRFNSLSKKKS